MVTPRVSGKNYQRKSAKSAGGYHDATGNVMCIYTRHGDTLTAGERPIYGSKRLGELRQQIKIGVNGLLLNYHTATIGFRHYELTDHLGNVMAVVSDRKTLSTDSMYIPDVISYTDYYPFGFPIESRSWDLGDYRYGFNGQESDDEVHGEKQSYTAEFWQYDSRLGRRWNVDPVYKEYESPYACFAGNPIWFVDPKGDSSICDNKGYMIYYDSKDRDLRVFMKNGDDLQYIGNLGGEINASFWFANLLKENAQESDKIWNPFIFKNNVQKFGKWDYKYASKANPNSSTRLHLLGIAFYRKDAQKGSGDLSETYFIFNNLKGRAEDLNNFHFGVVGKASGLFTETIMLKLAGKAEMNKWAEEGKTVPASWRPLIEVTRYRGGIVPTQYSSFVLGPPYGDNPTDYQWILNGFDYYKKNKEKLDE